MVSFWLMIVHIFNGIVQFWERTRLVRGWFVCKVQVVKLIYKTTRCEVAAAANGGGSVDI